MKTSKRKRSAKAAPALEPPVVDAVAAESLAPAAIEHLLEGGVETAPVEAVSDMEQVPAEPLAEAIETVDAAVESLVEAVAQTVEAVTVDAVTVDAVAEPLVEAVVETQGAAAELVTEAVAEIAQATAEPAVDAVDPTAETVVADTAAPAAEPAPAELVVQLTANCSVKDAAALKTSLCAVANESYEVTLDVSAVERVDTATMQLLCAFVRDRSGRNQSVTWRGESQALRDAVRLLGLEALLALEPKGVAA